MVDLVVSQACRPDERADADVSLLGADDLVVSQACRADELSLKKKALFNVVQKTSLTRLAPTRFCISFGFAFASINLPRLLRQGTD